RHSSGWITPPPARVRSISSRARVSRLSRSAKGSGDSDISDLQRPATEPGLSRLSALASVRPTEERQEGVEIHGLDEVMVEPRGERPPPVLILSIPGDCDDDGILMDFVPP